MTKDELAEKLKSHAEWVVSGARSGVRANLFGADLPDANLSGANLVRATLSCAYLVRANLSGANLSGANLSDANLVRAKLSCAYLFRANLSGANLSDANLSGANLIDANLSDANLVRAKLSCAYLVRANLSGANLSDANLSDANLIDANLSDANLVRANLTRAELPAFAVCPESGSFTAWKKLREGVIAELIIPAGAKRTSSLVGRKCRAEYAEVVSLSGGASVGFSLHDKSLKYRVGEIVRPDSYDDDIRTECSNGIHFFITREAAEAF